MAVPDFQSLTLPLLQLSGDGQIHRLADARGNLATRLGLSEDDRKELLPSGRQTRLANRVAWAKIYLERAGLLESPERGQFRITERGREVLGSPPERIDISFLNRFPEFAEFRSGHHRASESTPPTATEQDATPEEALEGAYERLQTDLARELLERVRGLAPDSFERLVVDVMLHMGYGGGKRGSTTQHAADGGIDGIINEDRLGLDVIYLQAKRWENPVGRPEIQKFVGALHGRRARKGVFITTSRFTPDAVSYVESIDPRVVLVDGENLARLMIDHEVGVATSDTLKIRRVDADYFAEE
jgi:restriction system protein